MIGQLRKPDANLPGEQVLNRIAALTLAVGFATAALALALHRPDWAKGLAGGAVLGWLNFRWLRRGIRAVVTAAMAQAWQSQREDAATGTESGTPAMDAKSPASQLGTFFALIFRYALVAFGVYVIFIYLHVPLVSIGLGLCALIAAIMTASVWEIVKPGQ
jgi:hypothetical protein